MGELKRWVATLFGFNQSPAIDPVQNIADREAERAAALAKFGMATAVRDTRAQHAAYLAARAATNAALRVEVGR